MKSDEFMWENYKVKIKCNATGEVRIRNMNVKWYTDEGGIYWWTQGNFACDCNRQWEFERAGNEGTEKHECYDSEDTECGHSKYTVFYAEMPDGSIVYLDEIPEHIKEEEFDKWLDEMLKD